MLSTTPKELIAKYKDDNPGLYCFLFDLYFYMEEDETINIIPDNILLSIGNSSLNLSQKMAIGTFISDWILDEDESKFDRRIKFHLQILLLCMGERISPKLRLPFWMRMDRYWLWFIWCCGNNIPELEQSRTNGKY